MLDTEPMARVTALLGAASRAGTLEARAVYLAVARGLLEAERERLSSVSALFDAQEKELVRQGGALAPLTPDAAHGDKVHKT